MLGKRVSKTSSPNTETPIFLGRQDNMESSHIFRYLAFIAIVYYNLHIQRGTSLHHLMCNRILYNFAKRVNIDLELYNDRHKTREEIQPQRARILFQLQTSNEIVCIPKLSLLVCIWDTMWGDRYPITD
jgi:hypothetical protein